MEKELSARITGAIIVVIVAATVGIGAWRANWALVSAGLFLAGSALAVRKTALEVASSYRTGLSALERRLNRVPRVKDRLRDPMLRETELQLLGWAMLAAGAGMRILVA